MQWLYKPRQPKIHIEYPFDLVVPLEYGALESKYKFLPSATIQCVRQACEYIKSEYVARIAWGSTGYFGPGVASLNKQKLGILKQMGVSQGCVVAMVESNNSIQEAKRIHDVYPLARRILLVCDWRHARRLRIIWEHVYPNAVIIIDMIDAAWDEQNHLSVVQRSPVLWLGINLAHHIALRVLGVKRLEHRVHYVKRKEQNKNSPK